MTESLLISLVFNSANSLFSYINPGMGGGIIAIICEKLQHSFEDFGEFYIIQLNVLLKIRNLRRRRFHLKIIIKKEIEPFNSFRSLFFVPLTGNGTMDQTRKPEYLCVQPG